MEKIVSILLLLAVQPFSFAAQIVVDSNSGGLGSANQLCTLRGAIHAAETDQAYNGCSAGNNADVIILPENANIVFNQIDSTGGGSNALPRIITEITIEGNNATLRISSNAPQMRFLKTVHHIPSGDRAHLTIKNLTFKNGNVSGSGGAIENNSDLFLDQVVFENNHASFEGGALNCTDTGALCDVTNSVFIGNSASYAGAIHNQSSDIEIKNSFIYNNVATIGNGAADVGAIHIESGNYLISNSTIAYNQATRYGGLLVSGAATGFIEYATIVENAPIGLIGPAQIKNSILSNNMDGNCRSTPNVISLGFNHSDDNTCTTFNKPGDVRNQPVSLGGLTSDGSHGKYYPLNYDSPAIDSANPGDCTDQDQRGMQRPQDGNNDGNFRCDKGAFEQINRMIFTHGFE